VTNGGGDVTVQSSGLSINLVTKSGSNVFKGSAVGTFENDATQGTTSRRSCSTPGRTASCRATRSIRSQSTPRSTAADPQEQAVVLGRRRQAGHQRRRRQLLRRRCGAALPGPGRGAAAGSAALKRWCTYDKLEDVQKCLSNDKTVIKDLQWKFNYQ
jgi:hypothetical protein